MPPRKRHRVCRYPISFFHDLFPWPFHKRHTPCINTTNKTLLAPDTHITVMADHAHITKDRCSRGKSTVACEGTNSLAFFPPVFNNLAALRIKGALGKGAWSPSKVQQINVYWLPNLRVFIRRPSGRWFERKKEFRSILYICTILFRHDKSPLSISPHDLREDNYFFLAKIRTLLPGYISGCGITRAKL